MQVAVFVGSDHRLRHGKFRFRLFARAVVLLCSAQLFWEMMVSSWIQMFVFCVHLEQVLCGAVLLALIVTWCVKAKKPGPAIVTALLGMFTGQFVRLPEEKVSGGRKVLYLLGASVVLLAAGLLWSKVFPINKALWSSSFVLVVGAYSVAMFALFYWLIDVKGWRRWTTFFKVVGMNSITIYLAQRIINFGGIRDFFFGGLAGLFPEPVGNVILDAAYIAVCWLFLYFLYKKKVFLKV